jgi:hypothetical protein
LTFESKIDNIREDVAEKWWALYGVSELAPSMISILLESDLKYFSM